MLEHLRYLTDLPPQPSEAVDAVTWTVRGTGPYVIDENGDHLAPAGGPDDVLYEVFRRAHWRVLERMALAGWHAVHAASLLGAEGWVALVGSKGAGKTTLACAAAVAGLAVGGDEILFVRDGEALPHPRPFHVKASTFDLLHGLPEPASLPTSGNGPGAVAAYEPSRHGAERVVAFAPLGAVVLLDDRRGDTPTLAPLSTGEALPRLVGELFDQGQGSARRLAEALALVRSVPVHRLEAAAPEASTALLAELASGRGQG